MSKAAKTAKRAPARARVGRGKLGSSFDALMKETGDYEAVTAKALKRLPSKHFPASAGSTY